MGISPSDSTATPTSSNSTAQDQLPNFPSAAPNRLGPDGRYFLVQSEFLGKGGTAEVYLYKNVLAENSAEELVAIKLLIRDARGSDPVKCADYAARTVYEILTMRRLRHAHIAKIKEVILMPDSSRFALALVMDYVPGGDLVHNLEYKQMSEMKARWIFQQLILTLEYLHSQGTAHRDIKLENILLDNHKKPLITLCDFGLSKDMTATTRSNSLVGTILYLDPAVLVPDTERNYDPKKADIYACGVLLYVMMTKRPLIPAALPSSQIGTYLNPPYEVIEKKEDWDWEFPDDVMIAQDCRNLIKSIVTWDPEQRASIEDIKDNPWFNTDIPAGFNDYNSRARQSQEAANSHQSDGELQVEANIERMVTKALIPGNIAS